MGKDERHALGLFYEIDILKIIKPSLIKPYLKELKEPQPKLTYSFKERTLEVKILDPACGSGNFLYVAYREIKRLESLLLEVIASKYEENR